VKYFSDLENQWAKKEEGGGTNVEKSHQAGSSFRYLILFDSNEM